MKVLGIDPGIDIMGFAVATIHGNTFALNACGVIRTDASLSTPERLVQLRDDLEHVMRQYPDVDVAGIEELFFSKNVTTAGKVWQARGVILETVQRAGIPRIVEMTPNQIKMAVVGNGGADKMDVQRMVAMTFGLPDIPKPDDAADAAAIALAAEAYVRTHTAK